MRIIHLSDLHICTRFKKNNIKKIKSIIEYAAQLHPDHLVITGDVSDNSNEADYLVLKKILLANNLYSSDKTTVIPGNHDIFGGVQKAEDILKFPQKCKSVDLNEKLNSFVEFFGELFNNAYFPLDERKFPFAKIFDKIVLFGLNTTDEYSSIKNPMASNGRIDKVQLNALKELMEGGFFDEHFKVILAHHHFYRSCDEVKSSDTPLWNKIEKFTMKLRGKRKIVKLFKKNNIGLVLHGHSHDLKEYERKGIKFINAGGAVENGANGDAGMFIIDVENNQASIKPVKWEVNAKEREKEPF